MNIECKICYDCYDYDLSKYIPPHAKLSDIQESNNGFQYFNIDGNTITFFSPVESDEIIYRVVICEIDDELLGRYNLTYQDLQFEPHVFTFNSNSLM